MNEIHFFLILFFFDLAIGSIIFYGLVTTFKIAHKRVDLVKGILERFFLMLSLVNNLPQSLIFFGALKVATSLKKVKEESENYYLIGNILSVTFVIIYYAIYNYLFAN